MGEKFTFWNFSPGKILHFGIFLLGKFYILEFFSSLEKFYILEFFSSLEKFYILEQKFQNVKFFFPK